MESKSKKRVLIVEDESNWQQVISELLQDVAEALDCVVEVAIAGSFGEALVHIVHAPYDCITIDNKLPDGYMAKILLDRIARLVQKVPVVVVSEFVNPNDVRDFFKDYEVEEFFWKTAFKPEAFRQTLIRLLAPVEKGPVSIPARTPEIDVQILVKSLPTGVLHLYSDDNLPLLKYNITNRMDKPISVIVSSWIEQFSYTRSDTVYLNPGQSQVVAQLPTLKLDEVAALYEVRRAVLHTRACYLENGQEFLIFIQDHDIQFLARDVIIWAIIVDENTIYDLSYQIAAWVTPNTGPIVEMLRYAADYSPSGQLWGYQGSDTAEQRAKLVRGQIKAIFQALKEKAGITYINAPISFGKKANEVQQRVNLPKDSLAYRQANCIDGAVLYASLIERAAMNPMIIIVPGHAFIGWETWDRAQQYDFLETTMTGSHSFEKALETGRQEFKKAEPFLGRSLFDPGGFAVLLDIKALRARGILPVE